MQNYITEALEAFGKLPESADRVLIPCTEEEIEELEALLPESFSLPGALKEFLTVGGHKIGRLFNSVDFSYRIIRLYLEKGHGDILRMLKPYTSDPRLPQDILILNEYSGESFTYLLLSEGDDPKVYFWEEGEGGLEDAEQEAESFSKFLLQQVENYVRRVERSA